MNQLTRFLTVGGVGIVVYLLLRYAIPRVQIIRQMSSSSTEVMRSLELPVAVGSILAACWTTAAFPAWIGWSQGRLQIPVRLLVILLGVVVSWSVIRRVALGRLVRHASLTESRADDVLLPIIERRILPVVIGLAALFSLFWAFGGSIGLGITTVGGLSFLLAFALQDPLSNLFAAVSLGLDVPFTYGDLISLEDGHTYEVRSIGSRVTELYDIEGHTLVYLPNSMLTQQKLSNLIQPNVELRARVFVGVSYAAENIDGVAAALEAAANSVPHIIGEPETKIGSLLLVQAGGDDHCAARAGLAIARIDADQKMRSAAEIVLYAAARSSEEWEQLNFARLKKSDEVACSSATAILAGALTDHRTAVTSYLFTSGLEEALYNRHLGTYRVTLAQERLLESAEEFGRLATVFGTGADERTVREVRGTFELVVRSRHPDLWNEDGRGHPLFRSWQWQGRFDELIRVWSKWCLDAQTRLRKVSAAVDDRGRRRLDALAVLTHFSEEFDKRFATNVPSHQVPGASLVTFGASTLDFQLDFFIDDLVRDQYERAGDVKDEVMRAIHSELRRASIEIPFPQLEVRYATDRAPSAESEFQS